MLLNTILVGDTTDRGGKVISGSLLHDVDGKPFARLGDLVDCPDYDPMQAGFLANSTNRSLGIAEKKWLAINASPWRPTFRSISATPRAHGSGDPTKTRTGCCDNTSRKGWTFPATRKKDLMRWSGN